MFYRLEQSKTTNARASGVMRARKPAWGIAHAPMSRGDEIRPADLVNIFEKIMGNPEVFKKVKSGDKIRVEKA